MTAGHRASAVSPGLGTHRNRPVALLGRNHRPHIGAKLRTFDSGSYRKRFRHRADRIDHLVMDALMHDQARHRRTDLSGIEENPPAHIGDQILDIRVSMNNGSGLAAKFENAGHHIARCRSCDRPPGGDRAGEHNLVDAGMGRKRRASLVTIAADNVERAPGKAGGFRCAGNVIAAQRVEFRGLDHTRVAGRQGCRQRSRGHLQRIVPGDHLCRDAIGLVHGEIEITVAQRDRPAFDGFSLMAVIFEIARRAFNFDAGFPQGLAAFQRQDRRDFVNMGEQVITHRLHHAAPFNRA